MNPSLIKGCLKVFELGLSEDLSEFDHSAAALSGVERNTRAVVIAKESAVFCGEAMVMALQQLIRRDDYRVEISCKVRDGQHLLKGSPVVSFQGNGRHILCLERVFLNLISRLSGISTAVAQAVSIVQDEAQKRRAPRITHTRKLLPGYRMLDLYAVQVGGGFLHRTNLSAGVMLKENHLALFREKKRTRSGHIAFAIECAKKNAPHTLKIEVEVCNQEEAILAFDGGADILMLDNFSPAEIRQTLKAVVKIADRKKVSVPLIEVSGGITLENLSSYVLPGVDVISMGSITTSVKPVDFSLLFKGSTPALAFGS